MKEVINSGILRTILPLIMVCLVSLPVHAQYAGGFGRPVAPYQIATAADLVLLGKSPEDADKHFVLTADIDLDPSLPGGQVFDRGGVIGNFYGKLDGDGHVVANLTISTGGPGGSHPNHAGLFGFIRRDAR